MHTQAEVVVRTTGEIPGPEIMSDFRLQLRTKKQILQLERVSLRHSDSDSDSVPGRFDIPSSSPPRSTSTTSTTLSSALFGSL